MDWIKPRGLDPALFGRGRRYLSEPVDSTVLIYLRVVVGITAFFWADSFLVENKYDPIFLQPRFLFKYDGFQWVKLWPGDGIYWHFVITKVLGLCLAAGLATRLSAAVISLSIAYVLLVERQIYVNHYYLLSCTAMLLAWLPTANRWSLDTKLGIASPRDSMKRWQLWLLRFQIGLPYVGGAVAKFSCDWLAGQPAASILELHQDDPLIGHWAAMPAATWILVYGGLLLDALVVPLLLFRCTRWWAVAAAVVFHLSNAYTLDIGVFPWFMLATLAVFFPVQTIPERVTVFLGRSASPRPQPVVPTATAQWFSRAGGVAAIVYVTLQIAIPIRPWLVAGDPNWLESGHRFSWRMMMRHKLALTHFLLIDDSNGTYAYFPSTIVLTPTQARRADHHPELVRQTALEFSRIATAAGASEHRVYALALVSLNGRQPVPLVNPCIDLSKVTSNQRSQWVMPDPGPFRSDGWDHPREQWWQRLTLPEPHFRSNLQGKTPSQLEEHLQQMRAQVSSDDQAAGVSQNPRGNPDKYWEFPAWLSRNESTEAATPNHRNRSAIPK